MPRTALRAEICAVSLEMMIFYIPYGLGFGCVWLLGLPPASLAGPVTAPAPPGMRTFWLAALP